MNEKPKTLSTVAEPPAGLSAPTGYACHKLNQHKKMNEDETFRICHLLGFNMVATAFSFHEYRLKWLKKYKPELFKHNSKARQPDQESHR